MQRSINLSAMNAHAKGLELITDIDRAIPQVLIGDPLRLQQIIVNLVNNAVKFTEEGAVCIKIRIREECDTRIKLECSVIDTGIGMSHEQQSKMFQSFSQADESVTRKHGGTGLGLAISKQLCELMGGEIWLKSELGKGSEFHFTVVVDKIEQIQEAVNLNPEELAKLRVLVVDDMSLAREVLVNILDELGINAEQASGGEQAIKMTQTARQAGNPYDMVLMDWRMPELDGIETSKRIQEEHLGNSPHILMVSAYDKDDARSHLSDTQINQFIEKPVNHAAIMDAITRMMAGDKESHMEIDHHPVMEAPNLSTSKLLLVEDNAINRQVAMGFLNDTGVAVEMAHNGLVALEKLQESPFDLVLMDIQMPEMDGLTATREIRGTLGMTDIPIVAMTAHAMETDIERSKAAGMNDHITKPIDPDILYRSLMKFLKVVDAVLPSLADRAVEEPQMIPVEDEEAVVLNQLNDVEGLQAELALAKMNGRTALYLNLVKDFDKDQRNLINSLNELYTKQAWEELHRTVHSLKSNAAYIGAFEVAALGQSLENALAEGDYDKEQLTELCSTLSPLLDQLRQIYEDNDEAESEVEFSAQKFKDSLQSILPLLRNSDFSVEDLLPDLAQMCAQTNYNQEIETLLEYVDEIEYEKAAALTQQLLETLD